MAAILAELRQRGVPLPPGDLWPPASIWAFTTRHGAVRAASHIPPLRIRDSA